MVSQSNGRAQHPSSMPLAYIPRRRRLFRAIDSELTKSLYSLLVEIPRLSIQFSSQRLLFAVQRCRKLRGLMIYLGHNGRGPNPLHSDLLPLPAPRLLICMADDISADYDNRVSLTASNHICCAIASVRRRHHTRLSRNLEF